MTMTTETTETPTPVSAWQWAMLDLKAREVALLERQVKAAEAAAQAGWKRAEILSLLALLVSFFALVWSARKQIRAVLTPGRAERARLDKPKAEERAKRQAAKELDDEEEAERRHRQAVLDLAKQITREMAEEQRRSQSQGPRRSARVSRPPPER